MNAYEIIGWLGRHIDRMADLCMDSRQIQPGDVFFACPGASVDGRDFIDDAVARGAVAIIAEEGGTDRQADVDVPYAQVRRLTHILGEVAHHWYREPSRAVSVVAVTGTNGKTTCVNWIASALNAQGLPCGTIGTLGVMCPDGQRLAGALTTPDILTMHRSLATLRDAGALVVALEASSIGIDQGRLDHVHIEIAALTNVSHDHLDYHGTFDAYKAAKRRLFGWPQLGAVVINIDDEVGRDFCAQLDEVVPITYSIDPSRHADIQASEIEASGYGLVFNLRTPRGQSQLLTRMVGIHNVSNLLLVAGVLRQLGWGMSRTVRELGALAPVQGRMEVVEPLPCGQHQPVPMVVVDYSHTPDALERALEALDHTARARDGRLICVVGCGGGRDADKRPMMGRVAQTHANRVVLTSDNPRNEDPTAIIEQMRAGMASTADLENAFASGARVAEQIEVEPSRSDAILGAIWSADDKDVILLAGKGHETTQEFADRVIVFDDRQWAQLALTWRRGLTLSTDTRSVASGELFWALSGERFDGHDYLETARQAGACAAVVSKPDPDVGLAQIVVHDTRAALTTCASVWRRQFGLPVIGVTGSNGKTTTKEMIAHIVRAWQGEAHVLATRGNLNNDLGVPMTVMGLRAPHQVAVIEMGMNQPGEIAKLAAVAQPTIGLVNNAQREHLEFMLNVDAVAKENGAVLQSLPADGVAVFPADDTYTAWWKDMAAGRTVLTFGFDATAQVYADTIHAQPNSTTFTLHAPEGSDTVTLRVQGQHNLRNALAAATCAVAAGAPLNAIVRGLEAFDPVAGRTQAYELGDGLQLIDDTYNANPDSVRAAIDVLASLQGRRILVLGDMAEVGADAALAHAEMGEYAVQRGIDAVLTLGTDSQHAALAFGAGGTHFEALDDLLETLISLCPANILVKGSRSARMERVVQALEKTIVKHTEGDGGAA